MSTLAVGIRGWLVPPQTVQVLLSLGRGVVLKARGQVAGLFAASICAL